jgi:GNAT superfamily N-acetyltransferase
MIRAKANDKRLIVDILSNAFDDNKSVNFVVKNDGQRKRRIRALMEYAFDRCHNFGEVWLSVDLKACALVLFPVDQPFSFRALFWDLNLLFRATGVSRTAKILNREKHIKINHPGNPFCHLWFIGVYPSEQSKGYGTVMLENIIKRFEQRGLPIYLETSVERNIPWYERSGFTIYNTIKFDYTLFLLKREPER